MKQILKSGVRLLKTIWRMAGFFLLNSISHKKDEEYLLCKKGFITKSELFALKLRQKNQSVLLGKEIAVTDSFWYLHSLKELFIEEVYRFKADSEVPYILDCGSNMGLSVIYFKRLYPKADIVAFEPDENIFAFLKSNLHAFGYDDVVVKNRAIWTEETTLEFELNGSLGSKVSVAGQAHNVRVTKVLAERLHNYLNRQVDFLKIDIEGPEVDVLKDCADELKNVRHLFVEYHSEPSSEQKLDELLLILKSAGFKYYIREAWNNLPYPFLRKDYGPFYDLQLNIFAYRP